MTDGIARFLAINTVLNGHPLLDAFGGDRAFAARALDMEESVVQTLNDKMVALEEAGDSTWCEDIITRVILNLIRTREYAFVQTPQGPVYYQEFAESDRQGHVKPEVREAVLSTLIQDVQYANMSLPQAEIRYYDGLLMLPQGEPLEGLKDKVYAAYKLYCHGPGTGKEPILKMRHSLSVSGFVIPTASKTATILTQLAKGSFPPSAYTRSTLMVTDLLLTYQETGAICEHSRVRPGNVDFLMNCESDGKDVSVSLSLEALNTVVRSGVRNLGRAKCVSNVLGKSTVYQMEYGGRIVSAEG